MKTAAPAPFYTESVYYNRFLENHGKASDCIGCKQREELCPRHLGIVDYLKDVVGVFEKKQGT